MRFVKKIYLILLIFVFTTTTGCFNYREINELHLVAGASIDVGSTAKFDMSTELINVSDPNKPFNGVVFSSNGRTIFECIRDFIMKSGKKLYWGDCKVMILSREIAEKGLISIIDMPYRDAEIRDTLFLLVSAEPTAKEILDNPHTPAVRLNSYHIEDIMKSESNISKFHTVQIWRFIKDLYTTGIPHPPSGKTHRSKEPEGYRSRRNLRL